jgi:hypothetical protein
MVLSGLFAAATSAIEPKRTPPRGEFKDLTCGLL